ncbi:hypothetical protein M3182_18930 [Mesobacillus maritimus]|uniref:Ger(x)C family spore germination protein n=1 Tax=Mesobacillus maritimus TaxID=1643336 RepID=UPI00203C906A|nr:hypothetical protein [Mesobacillus maritimus]MCM3587807.1 hypothetical protein [Mesobacillus maritimus]
MAKGEKPVKKQRQRFGQLRMLFIDEQIAKTGIINLLDTLLTDPEVSPRLFLVLFKGDFEAYAKNQMQKQKDLDYYLYRMFKHYEKENQGEITVTNIHEFIEKTYTYFPVIFQIKLPSLRYLSTANGISVFLYIVLFITWEKSVFRFSI